MLLTTLLLVVPQQVSGDSGFRAMSVEPVEESVRVGEPIRILTHVELASGTAWIPEAVADRVPNGLTVESVSLSVHRDGQGTGEIISEYVLGTVDARPGRYRIEAPTLILHHPDMQSAPRTLESASVNVELRERISPAWWIALAIVALALPAIVARLRRWDRAVLRFVRRRGVAGPEEIWRQYQLLRVRHGRRWDLPLRVADLLERRLSAAQEGSEPGEGEPADTIHYIESMACRPYPLPPEQLRRMEDRILRLLYMLPPADHGRR